MFCVHLIHRAYGLGGHFYPRGAKAAADSVAHRTQIAPRGTVKGAPAARKDLKRQAARHSRGDPLPAVRRENVHPDLLHRIAIGRAGGKTHEAVAVIGADAENVKLTACLAKGI